MHSLTPLLKKLFLVLTLVSVLSATACKPEKTAAQKQAEKVDAFRKHQKLEAIKAYTDLVNKFPDSEHVAEAKERLKVLGPLPATPTPAKKK